MFFFSCSTFRSVKENMAAKNLNLVYNLCNLKVEHVLTGSLVKIKKIDIIVV